MATTPNQMLRNKTRNQKEIDINRVLRAIPNLPDDLVDTIGIELEKEV